MGDAVYEHGAAKFPGAGLLMTSAERAWTGIAAEVRSHPAGELPPFTSSQLELTLALRGASPARVLRRGDGVQQDTVVRPRTLWLCPIGVSEDEVRITGPLPEILHVYLPAHLLGAVSEDRGGAALSNDAINYTAGFEDDLLRQMAYAILQELQAESAGGKLLVEALALAMAARLANAHSSAPVEISRNTAGRLDGARLKRVLDYIADHDDEDLTVADLAAVACLSRFHFARAFREATGATPHRYVSARRLERAKLLLVQTGASLAQIALSCSFSSQANFTRAFRRATGLTPGEYRRAAGRPSLH
jgi:AraC family transcriptional regulator